MYSTMIKQLAQGLEAQRDCSLNVENDPRRREADGWDFQ